MSQERGRGLPPQSFARSHVEGETATPAPSSGPRVRELLIRAGVLVPFDVVALRSPSSSWTNPLGLPLLRLLGSEDWRPRESEPRRGPDERP
jgi:hypothetical protein